MTADDLRAWRKKMKFSQEEAAEALGVHRRTLQNYEKGRDIPKPIDWACGAVYHRVGRWSVIRKEMR